MPLSKIVCNVFQIEFPVGVVEGEMNLAGSNLSIDLETRMRRGRGF